MSALILKLIAAVTMAIDHAGLILFANEPWMRAVGRLAFPLYAFFIAEGFRYTRNRKRYFLGIFLLGVFCQIVCEIAMPGMMLGVLLTFSLSILLLALLELAKKEKKTRPIFAAALLSVFVFCYFVEIDYGFFGVILPLFPTFFEKREHRLLSFGGGLFLLCMNTALAGGGYMQCFSLLSLALLALYSGKRGKYGLKYFFYIFYPLHLAALYLIAFLLTAGI